MEAISTIGESGQEDHPLKVTKMPLEDLIASSALKLFLSGKLLNSLQNQMTVAICKVDLFSMKNIIVDLVPFVVT